MSSTRNALLDNLAGNNTPKENFGKEQNTGNEQRETHATTEEYIATLAEKYGVKKLYKASSFFEEMNSKPEPIEYLIEDYVQESAMHTFFGSAGCGKSYTTLDMALSIASPEIDNWHGLSVHHGPVVYFVGEGQKGFKKRMKAWEMTHNVNSANVQFIPIYEAFKINDERNPDYSIEQTINNIKLLCELRHCGAPVLVVVDTLSKFLDGDENTPTDANKYISTCYKLIQAFNCAVVTITHNGWSTENKGRPKGSVNFHGDVDIELYFRKEGDSTVNIDIQKNRDGEEKKGFKLALRKITLPPDWNTRDGKPTTACYVEQEPYTSTQADSEQGTPMSDNEELTRNTFLLTLQEAGIRYKDTTTGHELACVDVKKWRKIFYDYSDAPTQRAKQQQFLRGRDTLKERGLLIQQLRDKKTLYCIDLEATGEETYRHEVAQYLEEHEQEQTRGNSQQVNIPITENDAGAGEAKGDTGAV